MRTRRTNQSGAARVPQPQPADSAPPIPWLWWRAHPDGRSRAQEELLDFPAVAQAELLKKIDRYRRGESRRREIDTLCDGILEIRHRDHNFSYRVLFMRWGRYAVGLTAFCKKAQKTPPQDLDRARSRAKLWREMHGKEPAN